jgi:hypothetical protein
MRFETTNLKTANEKVRELGILANFDVDIYGDIKGTEHLIVRLKGLSLRRSKSGNIFVASPAKEFQDREGQKKWLNFINFFPESRDDLQAKFTASVVSELEKLGPPAESQRSRQKTDRPARPPERAAQPEKTAKSSSSDSNDFGF